MKQATHFIVIEKKKQNTKELAFMCFFKTKNFLLKKQHNNKIKGE